MGRRGAKFFDDQIHNEFSNNIVPKIATEEHDQQS